MIHNFQNSLRYEKHQAQKADVFYREVLKASEIIRFSSDDNSDMEMQRQDVDLLLTLNEITYRVSEKFRDKDFGDLYVEVFSKYPKNLGWLHTGTPNAILYFTPKVVYWITHKSLSSFCHDVLFPLIPEAWYDELYTSHKSILPKLITLNGKSFSINLIQAHNSDGKKWETIGISLPFWVLEMNNVKIKRFDL